MVVPLEGSPLSTEKHWCSVRVTIGFLVTSLTKALLPQTLNLAGWAALGRVLVVPNLDEPLCSLCSILQIFFCTLPQICALEVYRQFLDSCHDKGCEYLCTFNNFANISNKLLLHCHYGVLFVEF